MALKINGRDDNIKRNDIVAFGIRFGLQKKALHSMLDKLIAKFKKFNHLLYNFPQSEKESKQIKDMLTKRLKGFV